MLTRSRTATHAVVAALLVASVVTGCSGDSSSGTPSATEPATESATTSSSTPSSSDSPAAADAASEALCSALTNAVGAGTPWRLGEAQPGARDLGGVTVPSCEVGASDGDPQTRVTVAYLPSTEGLAGLDLLAALCQAVVGAKGPTPDGRSCAVPTKPPGKSGTELRRADLTTKDAGVLVLSFASKEPSYQKTSVADLETVGRALADDQLLAMATG